MSTPPVRVAAELYAGAKAAAAVSSRSVAQQITHWARIGRELEASPSVRLRDVEEVLAGDRSYDDLGERAQAVVRAEWARRMAERTAALDLAAEFTVAGESWSEADTRGHLVVKPAEHTGA